jgi:hypothetical protein
MSDDVVARLTASLADRYTIERELGSGGMAIVYLAHDRKLNRAVAIRSCGRSSPHHSVASDSCVRSRLLRS